MIFQTTRSHCACASPAFSRERCVPVVADYKHSVLAWPGADAHCRCGLSLQSLTRSAGYGFARGFYRSFSIGSVKLFPVQSVFAIKITENLTYIIHFGFLALNRFNIFEVFRMVSKTAEYVMFRNDNKPGLTGRLTIQYCVFTVHKN